MATAPELARLPMPSGIRRRTSAIACAGDPEHRGDRPAGERPAGDEEERQRRGDDDPAGDDRPVAVGTGWGTSTVGIRRSTRGSGCRPSRPRPGCRRRRRRSGRSSRAPASQPISVPSPMQSSVTTTSSAPASPGGNARGWVGSIAREHSGAGGRVRVRDSATGAVERDSADFVARQMRRRYLGALARALAPLRAGG